jgi:hypothetical protein
VGNKYKGQVGRLVRRSLQEGQLFWTVIAMCASASYEAAVHLSELKGSADSISRGTTIAWTAISWHITIIIVSSVLVLLGTMDAADEEAYAARIQAADGIPRIMLMAIGISTVTAISFTVTHVWAS